MDPPKVPCQIPELNLSCYGCCSPGLGSEKEVLRDVRENTIELNEILDKVYKNESKAEVSRILENEKNNKKAPINFKERYDNDQFPKSGVCFNLVQFSETCFACPLHNKINEIVPKNQFEGPKKDLRVGHCDVNYECETFIYYKLMSDEQKKLFVKWVKEKGYNFHKYSIENIEGSLIKAFYNETY
jgi:hypothetical protein